MPKRSKNRSEDLAGGLGDADYDWIKYLGEGRAPASASASSAASASSSSSRSGRGARPAGPASRPVADDDTGPGGPGSAGRAGHSAGGYGSDGYGPDGYGPDGYGPDGYGAIDAAAFGTGGEAGYDQAGRGPSGSDHGTASYGPAGYGREDVDPGGYDPSAATGYGARGSGGAEDGARSRGSLSARSRGSLSDGSGEREPGGRTSGGRTGGSGPARGGPADLAPKAANSDTRTTPGRAVRLTAGRAVDLQANPAEALFNPAAEEYGQPLYAVPDRPDPGRDAARPGTPGRTATRYSDETDPGRSGDRDLSWPASAPVAGGRNRAQSGRRGSPRPTGPESLLDTGERSSPLSSVHDTGSYTRTPTGPLPTWPDDPFVDTDVGRRASHDRSGPAASTRALPAGRPDTTGRPELAGWPEITGEARAIGWPETTAETDAAAGQGTGIRPETTGWAEFDDGPATASWPETHAGPGPAGGPGTTNWPEARAGSGLAGGQGTAIWPEATGWPETEDEPGPVSPEPTGWPEVPDDVAFPLEDEAGATRQLGLAAGTADAGASTAASPSTRRKQKQSARRQAPADRKVADRKAGGRKAAGRKSSSGRKKAGVRPEAAIANAPTPAVPGLPGRSRDAGAGSTGPLAQAVSAGASARPASPATGPQPKKSAPGKTRRRGRRRLLLAGLAVILAGLAGTAYVVLRPQTSHVVSTPPTLGSFARQGANARAEQFKHRLMAAAGGEVKNVVAASYQRSTGPGTKAGPQIMVFIGGNLAGRTSASSLISAYMTQMHGSFSTSPGPLGGRAACAPGSSGGPAECAWADGDTFGVLVSATLSSPALASEMRAMRQLVEHVSK